MRTFVVFLTIVLTISQLQAQSIKEVNSLEAYEILKSFNHHSGVLIDGRDSAMFAAGHIDKAIQIDAFRDDLTENLTPYLSKEKILVYCTTHRRTNAIIEKLKELNYKGEIVAMMDGIRGWSGNNLPLSNLVPEKNQ
jgi:rhodanese-related sulfurtransferase